MNAYEDHQPDLVGTSNAVRELKKLSYRAARSELPVLITGESGTGKTLIARSIHELRNLKVRGHILTFPLFILSIFHFIRKSTSS